MTTTITKINFDPHYIGLEDRFISLFVDPRNGIIFMDEGDGEDRINGAALSPRNRPRFYLEPGDGSSQLMVAYAQFNLTLGSVSDVPAIEKWITEVNRFLIDCIPLHTRPEKTPQPLAAAG